ncbi:MULTISPECIES: hypothetical protein [Paenibacillus]|jgi:hypothetical protein|uniref:hypothetical protein n=1 Tax=Paenibacillus TaxID=44249 RepID=UPI0004F63354|nr:MULTISPECIES: hypothetical protein [unclassified Paenibacillus]AIQ32669.1 hypothetical protein P40081_34640 [Paenibacillus sp. FSL P4-0081]OMF24309.1 hypothetical protein BK132_24595 [Paenibacillus sp. FSL H8-0259]
MSVYTNEYTQVVVMTKSQVSQALTEQNAIIQHGIKVPNSSNFISAVSAVTSVLSLLIFKKTIPSLASGIVAVFSSLFPDEKASAEFMANKGLSFLATVNTAINSSAQYDQIEVQLPFLEYTYNNSADNWRFVSGYGTITRLHTPSGWINAN